MMADKKALPLWAKIVIDAVISGVLLMTFALFHHIIRYSGNGAGIVIEREMTDWREKFADKFTDEVISEDDRYSSPNISFTISEYRDEDDSCTYYVADIYIASLDCLRTVFADDTYGENIVEKGISMAERTNAVLLINGDYYGARTYGAVIRNSSVYRTNPLNNQDVCLLYSDGVMECIGGGEFSERDAIEKKVYQSWTFGPSLLNKGKAKSEFPSWYSKISSENPRSAIGYFEPGHYCFIAVDGRTDISDGMTFAELSSLAEKLGCAEAYALDGGISSFLVYNNEYVNIAPVKKYPGSPRAVSDAVYLAEPEKQDRGEE